MSMPVGTNLHEHLLTVTSGVGAVGGGQAVGVGTVLLEERGLAEVGSVTTGGQNDNTVSGLDLAVESIARAFC
jgi:hypothetical protein